MSINKTIVLTGVIMVVLWCVIQAAYANTSASPRPLLDAIEQVESSGNPGAVGDGGNAVGILQIHKVMVDDVDRILNKNRFSYDDRKSVAKSEQISIKISQRK